MYELGPKPRDSVHTLIGRGGFGNQLFQAAWALKLQSQGYSVRVDVGWYQQPTGGESRILEVDYEGLGIPTVTLSRLQRSAICRLPKRFVYTDNEISHFPHIGVGSKPFSTTYAQNAHIPIALNCDQIERLTGVAWGGIGTENSVAVHVRLGDYRTHAATRKHHAMTDPRWSFNQAQKLSEEFDFSNIVVHTDEPEWLSKQVPQTSKMTFAPAPPLAQQLLHLMCSSRALVMSNSSLSWWAGFLLSKRDPSYPVIFPTPWNRQAGLQDQTLALPEWRRTLRSVV